jgi:hypothetical protein
MKAYVLAVLAILFLLLAVPAAAQSPTETPYPTPTMKYYGRATLMAGIGVKPYHLIESTPFDLVPKVIGQVPEAVSWFKTFTFLMAENGALMWLSAVFVMLLVAFILIAILSHIRRTPQMTQFRSDVERWEYETVGRTADRIGRTRAFEIAQSLGEARNALKSARYPKKGRK